MCLNTDSHASSCEQNLSSVNTCIQGHDWQPTIIIGYFQCTRCQKLAACQACVSKVRGRTLVGYCRAHKSLRSAETTQEVLG